MRPLAVSTGTHRDKTLPSSAVKVGVLGALATATIAAPLASATAGGQPVLDAAPAPAQPALSAPRSTGPVQLPTVAVARDDQAASRSTERAEALAEQNAAQEGPAQDGTGISVSVPEPEVVDESGVSLGVSGEGYILPVGGPITSPYGYRIHPVLGYRKFHEGVDFGAACGTPVHAAHAGTVTEAGFHPASGMRIKVDHGNGVATGYFHLQGFAVSEGSHVEQGQVVGYIGTTGRSTGCHLHFAAMDSSGNYFNPMDLLK